MENLSELLHINNKNNFQILWKKRVEEILRENIFDFILYRKNEDEYFDLDKYIHYGKNLVLESIKNIMEELKNLGWKVKLSFGDTGLFVYSTEDPPKTCW